MDRTLQTKLFSWKNGSRRKPLLLTGARQTGKSWLLKDFGTRAFEHVLTVDFEQDSSQARAVNAVIEDYGLDAARLLAAAGIDGAVRRMENTLIIFDEIQRNPRMFTALKYICRDTPEAFVVASGSLMGLALKENTRAPVGYVDIARMLPMTFYEFLAAVGEDAALNMLEAGDWNRYAEFSETLENRLQQYIIVGGMPEPVKIFVETGSLSAAREAQIAILDTYEQDFNVHTRDIELTEKIRHAWQIACALGEERNEDSVFFLDILPRLAFRKAREGGGFLAVESYPRRVPASTRLPRGISLGFCFQIPTVGNFTAANQRLIPPGLTISPQADTACPAAKKNYEAGKTKRQGNSNGAPYKRAADYYTAVRWLEDCGLIHVCRRCFEPTGMLAGHADFRNYNSFKVFPLDTGLRMAACGYPVNFFDAGKTPDAGALRGKIFEQYAFQQLFAAAMQSGLPTPAYYSWSQNKNKYEIDFMLPDGFSSLPVEVKGASAFRDVSLKAFREQFQPDKVLRLTPRNPGIEPPVWSLPLTGAMSVFSFIKQDMIETPNFTDFNMM